jgi:hypothetical protein
VCRIINILCGLHSALANENLGVEHGADSQSPASSRDPTLAFDQPVDKQGQLIGESWPSRTTLNEGLTIVF